MLVFVIFAIVGGGLAVHGARSLVRTRAFLSRAVRTEGEITGWRTERQDPGSSSRSYYARLRFPTPDGRTVETESDVPLSFWPADRDGPVTVLFDPARPERARLDSAGGRGYPTDLLFLIGGLVLAVGPYLLARL